MEKQEKEDKEQSDELQQGAIAWQPSAATAWDHRVIYFQGNRRRVSSCERKKNFARRSSQLIQLFFLGGGVIVLRSGEGFLRDCSARGVQDPFCQFRR